MPNKTNLVWINDPRRSDWRFQAKICAEKWLAVSWENKHKIRMSYGTNAYKKYMRMFE